MLPRRLQIGLAQLRGALALALEIDPTHFQLGRSKIFFRAGKGAALEALAGPDGPALIKRALPLLVTFAEEYNALSDVRDGVAAVYAERAKMIYKLIDGSEYKGGFRPSHLPKRLPPIARVHDAR